jgi:hypothetical protein
MGDSMYSVNSQRHSLPPILSRLCGPQPSDYIHGSNRFLPQDHAEFRAKFPPLSCDWTRNYLIA